MVAKKVNHDIQDQQKGKGFNILSHSHLLTFVVGVLVGHALNDAILFWFIKVDCRCNTNANDAESTTTTAATGGATTTNVPLDGLLNFRQNQHQAASLNRKPSTENTGNLVENGSSRPNADGWHPVYVYNGGISSGSTTNSGPNKGARDSSLSKSMMVIDKVPHNSLTFRENFEEYGSQIKQDEMIMKLMDQFTSHQQSLYEKKGLPASTFSTNFYFIDLAANDAIQLSNTLKLERLHLLFGDDNDYGTSASLKTRQHWKGLCIEPNPKYWFRLAHRECTVVGAFVGTDVDGTIMNVTNMDLEVYGGIVGDNMDNKAGERSKWAEEVDVTQMEERAIVSLPTVMTKFHVPTPYIDYLSLDVEGAEYLVMKSFPFDKYKIRIMTVERPTKELQQLLKQNGYVYVMQLASWVETLWVHKSFVKRSTIKPSQKQDSHAIDETCGLTLTEMQELITKVAGRKQIPKHFSHWDNFYGKEPW